jgi:ABC-type polysaccharide/polyol phosphate export permease
LSARFRGIPQIIAAITQLLFLLTPIVWMPGALKSPQLALIVDWNPVHYLIEVVRGPLLGQTPPFAIWITAMLLALASLAIGVAFYHKFARRVAYWL